MVRRLHRKGDKDAKRPKKRRTMTVGSQGGKRESRALVPLGQQEMISGNTRGRAAAPFVVQLAANAKGFAAYRTKRRANPADGSNSYRASAARIAVAAPLGARLNYCA
jgi:hypothetical protein